MANRSPYLVLGVERQATGGEIRNAYRQLALQHHPDAARSSSSEQFIEVRRAYDVLRDPDARRAYDQSQAPYSERRHLGSFGAAPAPERVPVTYSEERHRREFGRRLSLLLAQPFAIFDSFLDPADLASSGFVHQGRAQMNEDLLFDLVLSPEEAAHGGHIDFAVPLRHRCRACGGQAVSGGLPCASCGGRGMVVEERDLEVFVPPHVRDGQRASLPLEALGASGGEVTVTVRIH
jgi:DnaJ-class molecular chaperone